jgi:hypothetical protein
MPNAPHVNPKGRSSVSPDSLDVRAVERMSEILKDAPPIFVESIGPFYNCFSAEKLVNLFYSGAAEEDFEHIVVCDFCHLRITRYAEFTRQSLRSRISQNLSSWQKLLQWTGVKPRVDAYEGSGSSLLYIIEPTIRLSKSPADLVFTCDLISGIGEQESWTKIDSASVILGGPMVATSPQISFIDIKGKQIVRFSFHGARLADYVKRDLQIHQRLSDTIIVKGSGSPGGPPLLGRATVAIERAIEAEQTPCLM